MQHRLTLCAVLPNGDFNAAALQSLRAFPGQQPGERNGKVLYVPR